MRNQTKTAGTAKEITDFWYDPNGNQISSMTISTGGTDVAGAGIALVGADNTSSYSEYNSWNQLTKTMQNGKTASYIYNGDGLRMSKTVNGVTTSHIWDGTNIAADASGSTVTKYIRGLQLISSKKGSNESFYTYNGHGDVVQLTDGSGSITKKYSYDAFGAEYKKDSRDTNSFRYCGEYYDTETDSVYLRARYYRPTTGRFISEDPIMDGLNWYVYCENEPVMGLDPSGLAIYVPENRGTIEEYLKVISHNKIYIDDNGYVKKVDENYIPDYNNEIGTDLIFQLIDDKVNTCTIRIGDFNGTDRSNDEYASKSGVGCNAFVTFKSDYNNQDDVPVMAENGSVIKERQPVQIALGHELVHALRTMKGNRKRGYLKGTNAMVGGDNQEYTQEEFDTVGIDHWRDDGSYANASEWHFTENSLRRELGFCTRVRYYMR